jgi:hypothetical protein
LATSLSFLKEVTTAVGFASIAIDASAGLLVVLVGGTVEQRVAGSLELRDLDFHGSQRFLVVGKTGALFQTLMVPAS